MPIKTKKTKPYWEQLLDEWYGLDEYVVPLRHIHAYRADLEKFDLSQLVLKERKRGK